MPNGPQKYYEPIINMNGYVLFFPRVANESEKFVDIDYMDPYVESSTKKFPVGTIAKCGRDEYIYFKNSSTALTTLGVPIQSAAAIHAEASDDIVVGAASAIGVYTVTLTSTANLATSPLSTKDGFRDGFLIVNDAAGEGQLYQIKSHEAASGTSTFVVTLYDPLTVALTTSSEVGIAQHPCMNNVKVADPLSGTFVGVPLIAVTASYYAWAKTSGYAPCVAQEAIQAGSLVCVGETSGKVNAYSAAETNTEQVVIGIAVTPGVTDTESCIVDLGRFA